jgi:hypothetical protein
MLGAARRARNHLQKEKIMHRSGISTLLSDNLSRIVIAIAMLSVTLGLGAPAPAFAATEPVLESTADGGNGATYPREPGTGAVVTLRPGAPAAQAAADLRVLESRADGVRLEFELPALRMQEIPIAGETFQALAIDNGGFEGKSGRPMLPTFTRLIEIPDGMAVSWEVAAIEKSELAGYRPLPVQPEEGSGFAIDPAAYAESGYPAQEPVGIGEPAIARNLRVVPVTIRPVRFDPARGTIEVATHAEIDLRFTGTIASSSSTIPARARAKATVSDATSSSARTTPM